MYENACHLTDMMRLVVTRPLEKYDIKVLMKKENSWVLYTTIQLG